VRLNDMHGNPAPRLIAFGQVIGIHIDDRFIKDSLLDTSAMKPMARAGYQEYFVTTSDNRFFMEFARAGQVKPCLREDTDE
jgi:flavin reductase (DIM6/NTAB) family NADH-FMN oxidoreductase RutF